MRWQNKMKKLFQIKKAGIYLFLVILLSCGIAFQWKHLQKIAFFEKQIIKNPLELLNFLSDEEKEALELFFYYAFQEGSAYVLFGDKPMSICYFPKVKILHEGKINSIYEIAGSISITYHPTQRKIKKGWELLEKYHHLLQSSNFLIKKEVHFLSKNGVDFALIINKNNFLKAISCNIEDFQNVLGESITPEIIYEKCVKREFLLRDVLKGHEGLIGILLGYGRGNSWKYYIRNQLKKEIKESNLAEIDLKNKKEEFKKLNDQLKSFAETDFSYLKKSEILPDFSRGYVYVYKDFFPNSLELPAFVCDYNDLETIHLKQHYELNKKNIIHNFRNKDFLQIIIKKLSTH